ncbi:MAG: radical SAM protein [Lentisphaeria bacterium]|nr:radical SAM protein [Lentisphaeria bacterium]
MQKQPDNSISSSVKKILLVSIIEQHKYGNNGVDYLASYLRSHGFFVTIKYYHENQTAEEICNTIPLDYDFYGFSVFITNYKRVVAASRFLKSKTNSVIIYGGQFISMNYRLIIEAESNADYYIIGDGEEPIQRLMDFYAGNHVHQEFHDPNVATRNDYNHKTRWVTPDINRYPAFDYYESDTTENNRLKVYSLLSKSNVCNGACTFCCSRKGRFEYKTPMRLVDEIEYVAKRYGVRDFHFGDDNIFDIDSQENYARLVDFSERIISLNLNLVFSGFAKANSIRSDKRDLLTLMSEAGFYYLFIGVDAGNEMDRLLYNKRATLQENQDAITLLSENGIWARYGIISINPYSTKERLCETYRYLCKLRSANFYHYGGLHLQLLYGTKMYEFVKRDGLLRDDFSFLNVYGYKFQNEEILPVVDFLRSDFLPSANKIKYQFYRLKHCFEKARHLTRKVQRYQDVIQKEEEIEFQTLKEFFGHLYVATDLQYCKSMLPSFIQEEEQRARKYQLLCSELDEIIKSTPLERD